MSVDAHLAKIYADGSRNDASTSERSLMMLNITPSTGMFLDLLVSDTKPKRILELGTSNGYSTIWLARAARRIGARVDTVDQCPQKTSLAFENLVACDLQDSVSIHNTDCGDFLCECESMSYDFVFVDSDRSAYCHWAADLARVLRFGLMVVDNATTHPGEIRSFKQHLSKDLGFDVAVLPIGNGQMIVQGGQ